MSDPASVDDTDAASVNRDRRWFRRLAWCGGIAATILLGLMLARSFCIDRARAALERHDASGAREWLGRVDQLGSLTAEGHFLAARASRRLGDPEGLRRHLQLANELGWPQERLEREWTLAQAQVGLLEQAEPYLQEMLLNPGEDGPEILAAYANGFAHHYQFQRTFSLLDAWELDFPEDAEPHLMRGKIQQRWKNYPAAEGAYRAALQRDPNLDAARAGLAAVLVAQHQYEEAQTHFDVALAAAPDDVKLLTGWAECLNNLGQSEEAKQAFTRILELDSESCSARLGLGKIAFAHDQLDEALSQFEKAMALCPKRPDLRYVFAQALVAAGRRETATEHFKYFDEANSALLRVSQLTSHLVEHPDDLEARFEIGMLYMSYADAGEGANWLKTVLAVQPGHCATHRLLARYYSQTNQRELAERHRARSSDCADADSPSTMQLPLSTESD